MQFTTDIVFLVSECKLCLFVESEHQTDIESQHNTESNCQIGEVLKYNAESHHPKVEESQQTAESRRPQELKS